MSDRLKCALTISAVALALAILAAGAFAQTDDEIRALVAKAGEAKDYPEAGYVAVFEKIDVTVEETGLAHYRRHTLTKMLTDGGRPRESRAAGSITTPPPTSSRSKA